MYLLVSKFHDIVNASKRDMADGERIMATSIQVATFRLRERRTSLYKSIINWQ